MNPETHDTLHRVRELNPRLFQNPRFWLDVSDQEIDPTLLSDVVALASGDPGTIEQIIGPLAGRTAISLRGAEIHGDLALSDRHFRHKLDLRGLHVSGGIDLGGATFEEPVNVSGSRVLGSILLSRTTFNSSAVMNRVEVDGYVTGAGTNFSTLSAVSAQFRSGVHFTDCTISGTADFSQSRFHSDATFVRSTFSDSVSFAGCSFQRAVFRLAQFGGRFDAEAATFSDTATFWRSLFSSHANLTSARFEASAHFTRAIFEEAVDFHDVFFGGLAHFHESVFHEPIILTARNVSFSRARILHGGRVLVSGNVNLARSVIDGAPLTIAPAPDPGAPNVKTLDEAAILSSLKIEHGVGFLGPARHVANLERVAVESTALVAARGRRMLLDDPDFPLPAGWPDRNRPGADEVRSQYRALRRGAEENADHASANDFYYSEMVMRRRAVSPSWSGVGVPETWQSKSRSWITNRATAVVLRTYGAVAGYGLKPSRAAVSFVALVVSAGFLASATGPFDPDCDTSGSCPNLSLAGSIQFFALSAVSISREVGNSLEYWETWLQLAVRLLGPVLLAILALGLRSKVRRGT